MTSTPQPTILKNHLEESLEWAKTQLALGSPLSAAWLVELATLFNAELNAERAVRELRGEDARKWKAYAEELQEDKEELEKRVTTLEGQLKNKDRYGK